MQYLYYKNKIINAINSKLPKAVLVWYVLLFTSVFVVIFAITSIYYSAYKIYTSQNEGKDGDRIGDKKEKKEEYEPVLDLNNLDNIISKTEKRLK